MSSTEFRYMTAPGVAGSSQDSGNWDRNGVPNYLEPEPAEIDADLLERLNKSLPEYISVPQGHPQYLDKSIQKNLFVTELANVWLTFVEEGAGYKNAVGIYTYPFDPLDPSTYVPTSFAQIESTRTIVFPNCSKPRKGGNLKTGDTVYLGQFQAGTAIGIFLVPNGFDGRNARIRSGVTGVYSNHEFNGSSEWVQTVMLKDEIHNRWIVSFEDIMRPAGDEDFNDCILFFQADPVIAIKEDGLLQLEGADPITKSVLTADRSGLHFTIEESELATLKAAGNSETYYRITHTMEANDEEHANLLERLFGYVVAEGLVIDETNKRLGSTSTALPPLEAPQNRVTRTGNTIEVQYLIAYPNLRQFTYLIRVYRNLDDGTIIDEVHEYTQFRVLELLEAFYVQESLTQTISVQPDTLEPEATVTSSDNVTSYLSQPQIWGDPHVVAMNGKTYTLPDSDDGTVFELFNDPQHGLDVRCEVWHHPDYADLDDPSLQHVNETTFMHRVSFATASSHHVFDLDSRTLQCTGNRVSVLTGGSGDGDKNRAQTCVHVHELNDDLCGGERLSAVRAVHGESANVRCVTICAHEKGSQQSGCKKVFYTFELLALPDTAFHLNEVNLRLPSDFGAAKPSWTAKGGRGLRGALVDGTFTVRKHL